MNTNNIISTPEITGNIGSCTSQVVSTISGRESAFIESVVNVVTNSCSGEVSTYSTWHYTPTTFFGFVGGIILASFIIALIKISLIPKEDRSGW